MTAASSFTGIFPQYAVNVEALLLTDPGKVEKEASSPTVAAWGSMALRRAGQSSPANDWLNHASRLGADDDLLKAELLGEAGRDLYAADRTQDAFKILNTAQAVWRDLCDQALAACAAEASPAAIELATGLLAPFEAAGREPPATPAAIRSGKRAVSLIRQWLVERAAPARAETAATFVRALAKLGGVDDARKICDEELGWIAGHFTRPAAPVAAHPLEDRSMESAVREAIYLLLLARGEVGLAAGEVQASADDFGRAAALYEEHAMDVNDSNRLLRAKFNQANSFLRLEQFAEAIKIYKLCEFGFSSLGDEAAAQRVRQAILFARTKAAGDDDA